VSEPDLRCRCQLGVACLIIAVLDRDKRASCPNQMTQEDLLCDRCRNPAGRLFAVAEFGSGDKIHCHKTGCRQ
jgi:hypothetical protein